MANSEDDKITELFVSDDLPLARLVALVFPPGTKQSPKRDALTEIWNDYLAQCKEKEGIQDTDIKKHFTDRMKLMTIPDLLEAIKDWIAESPTENCKLPFVPVLNVHRYYLV